MVKMTINIEITDCFLQVTIVLFVWQGMNC